METIKDKLIKIKALADKGCAGEVSGNGYTLMDHCDLQMAKKWSFYKHN